MIKIAVCDDNPYELEEVAEKSKFILISKRLHSRQ